MNFILGSSSSCKIIQSLREQDDTAAASPLSNISCCSVRVNAERDGMLADKCPVALEDIW